MTPLIMTYLSIAGMVGLTTCPLLVPATITAVHILTGQARTSTRGPVAANFPRRTASRPTPATSVHHHHPAAAADWSEDRTCGVAPAAGLFHTTEAGEHPDRRRNHC